MAWLDTEKPLHQQISYEMLRTIKDWKDLYRNRIMPAKEEVAATLQRSIHAAGGHQQQGPLP